MWVLGRINMKHKMYHIRLVLLLLLLPGLLLAGCSAKQREIPIGDHIVIFPSKYDGVMTDITSANPSTGGFARICRDLEELLELCPAAGIEYGADIPQYTEKWFEENAVIVLAFTEGIILDGRQHASNISVGNVFVDGPTAHVELLYISNIYFFYAESYTVVIEVEAKHLKNVESIAPPKAKQRNEEIK